MTTHKAITIVWNDRRVRTATVAFLLPLFTLLSLERFNSLLLSSLYVCIFSALTFYLTDHRFYQYSVQVIIILFVNLERNLTLGMAFGIGCRLQLFGRTSNHFQYGCDLLPLHTYNVRLSLHRDVLYWNYEQ
jgi:hypothetical protein